MKTVRNSLRAAAPKVLSADSPHLLAIAALLTGVAVILFNTLPVFVGAVAESLGFNNKQLGNLAAIYFAGHTLMAVTAPAWIRRLSWKWVTLLAASAGAVGFWLAAQFQAFLPLAVTLFCVGLCGGTLFVVGMSFAADSNKPARSFAVVFFVQIAMGTVLVFALPQWVTPRWGYSGVAIIYAVLFAVGALVALNFNAVSRVPHVAAAGSRIGFRARPGFGLVGILVLFLGASVSGLLLND